MRIRRSALYVALGSAVYLAWLVATIPATWIAQRIARASHGVLELRAPIGTAWAGRGQLFARTHAGGLVDLGALRWDALPARLAAGRFAANLWLGGAPKPLTVEWSVAGVTLRGLQVDFPAAVLTGFVPELDALDPQGRVAIRSDDLRLDDRSVLGLGEIEWRGVRLAPANGLALGSHFAKLRGGGAKVDFELGSTEGPLRLSGAGTWSRDSGLAVTGIVTHEANAPPELVRFLRAMCTAYKNRRCSFRFRQQ
jgi:general secretion pathway protein N